MNREKILGNEKKMTTLAPTKRQMTSFDLYKQGISSRYSNSVRIGGYNQNLVSRTNPKLETKQTSSKKNGQLFTVRKLVIGVLIVVSFLVVTLPATEAFGRLSLVSSERQTAASNDNVVRVVVEPGDTLWTIARKLEPNRDPREIIDQLVQARGTSNVYAGETIEWTK